MSWEVAEIVGICKRRGFVLPTVYEGRYNLLDRVVEDEWVQFTSPGVTGVLSA